MSAIQRAAKARVGGMSEEEGRKNTKFGPGWEPGNKGKPWGGRQSPPPKMDPGIYPPKQLQGRLT